MDIFYYCYIRLEELLDDNWKDSIEFIDKFFVNCQECESAKNNHNPLRIKKFNFKFMSKYVKCISAYFNTNICEIIKEISPFFKLCMQTHLSHSVFLNTVKKFPLICMIKCIFKLNLMYVHFMQFYRNKNSLWCVCVWVYVYSCIGVSNENYTLKSTY